jgi:hypothetical protein
VVPSSSATTILSVIAAGASPLIYSWDALNARGPVGFSLNDSSVAASTTVSFQVPGSYTFRVRVTDGNGLPSTATVNVNVTAGAGPMVVSPYQVQLAAGQNVSLRAKAWDQLGNLVSVSPAWSVSGGGTIDSSGVFYAGIQGGPYLVTAVAGALSATGFVWVTTSQTGLVAPTITTQPAAQTVAVGGNVSLNVAANGSAPLSYQWLFNGAPISGATDSAFLKAGVQNTDAGNYSVQVTNAAGTALSSTALLTVLNPPVITTQPLGELVAAGLNVTFSIVASGSAPLSYQWLLAGKAIAGATDSSYTKLSVQVADAGSYSVQVANPVGRALSSAAVLTVLGPPAITTQPLSQAVAAGSNVTFGVVASGTAPFTYQWIVGGTPIPGATDSTYTRLNTQTADAGNYRVQVANGAGSTLSSVATLTVNNPPVLAAVTDQTIHAGTLLMLTNTATDLDVPAQNLTFSLDPGSPANATINPTNGVLVWSPSLSQAGTSNLFTVRVTDDGAPSLSATVSFTIDVIAPLSVSSVSLSNATIVLIWQSIPGVTYRVEYSQDPSAGSWQVLGTNTVATGRQTSLTDTIVPSQRFYRVTLPN